MAQGFGARRYQDWVQAEDLRPFRVRVKETDLFILASADLSALAAQLVRDTRAQIESYVAGHPEFQAALEPVEVEAGAPAIIRNMAAAGRLAGVGPFASVAGALAETVGQALTAYADDVIVENGGDIFAASRRDRVFGIYAGHSPLTGKIGVRIAAAHMPCGVCTSSGTVGPSISYGRADAAVVMAQSTILADACATALGNRVRQAADIAAGLDAMKAIPGVAGAVVVVHDTIGAWGAFEFVNTAVPA
jgi:uncharacterized protein